ncbi:MAG: AAA family ATPase [Candidatus Moranbacteria bacterium]|nr:AAA family ATPase [Candidatus Moranbacteria bacterium]
MRRLIETKADAEIKICLEAKQSFSVIAGAGSGKTTSLVTALQHLRQTAGPSLRRNDQKIVCITYTNRAAEVISNRLDFDDLFLVATLHTFLWSQIKRFTPNIREAVREHIIPAHIENKQKDDNGGQSKKAVAARAKIASLQAALDNLDAVDKFEYNDNKFSDYPQGKLNHDDIIDIAAYLISDNAILRQIIGQNYPYIFVDEAQDTFGNVVDALNKVCENDGLPIVCYFGDPMQQIYDKRAGDFAGPSGSIIITKEENFRCSRKVIDLLNAFRNDVKQIPAGKNAEIDGSVFIRLVAAETPLGERKKYTEIQIERTSARFDEALESWGWAGRSEVKQLFLVRQMIAKRLGFPILHKLFTGQFASSNAQEAYEKGEHFLLQPFVNCLYPLVQAHRDSDLRRVFDILRRSSPTFDPQGVNAERTLGEMKERAIDLIKSLSTLWIDNSLADILRFCRANNLCHISDRLSEHLDRAPREEEYDDDLHSSAKGDWLVDIFFKMTSKEIEPFTAFIRENTPLSTQHGVKGEEYKDVVVVFDDIEAAWNNYSFTKTLTPNTSGAPTDGQSDKSRKLAYVCFSRAEENLRILLFTSNPAAAKEELISKELFKENQISIAS